MTYAIEYMRYWKHSQRNGLYLAKKDNVGNIDSEDYNTNVFDFKREDCNLLSQNCYRRTILSCLTLQWKESSIHNGTMQLEWMRQEVGGEWSVNRKDLFQRTN